MSEEVIIDKSQTSYVFSLPYGEKITFDDADIVTDTVFDVAYTATSLEVLNKYSASLYAGLAYYKFTVAKAEAELKSLKASITERMRLTTKGQVHKLDRTHPLYNKVYTEKDVDAVLFKNEGYLKLYEHLNSVTYILNRLTYSLQLIRSVLDTVRSFHVDIRNDLKKGVI